MSDYPSTLGDLADVEARLEAQITKLTERLDRDVGVTDEKFNGVHDSLVHLQTTVAQLFEVLDPLAKRVAQLERLWAIARENPELIRELAVQALKDPGQR